MPRALGGSRQEQSWARIAPEDRTGKIWSRTEKPNEAMDRNRKVREKVRGVTKKIRETR